MNEYLVDRYGDPCRVCGFIWSLDLYTAKEIIVGAADRLGSLRRAPAETTTPIRGTWGVAGYVAHMADTVRIRAERLAAASLDTTAAVVPYDEEALGNVMGYNKASLLGSLWALERALEGWRAAHALAEPDVRLVHSEQGPLTVDGAQRILAHEVHHHTMDIWGAQRAGASGNRPRARSEANRLLPEPGLSIARDDPSASAVAKLVRSHLLFSRAVTPRGHVHALEPSGLSDLGVDFFSARFASELVAVGAFKRLSDDHGEIKSMHTDPLWRGRGAGTFMVRYLVEHAKSLGCARVSLETGSMSAFEPARRLYSQLGFVRCPPFGDYTDNPYSVCMTRDIAELSVQ